MELNNLLKAELQTLRKYQEMFDNMTSEEKYELREWIANGRSVNSNPHLLYGENGCLLDFIEASRTAEDMSDNPEQYGWGDPECSNADQIQDTDVPF